MPHFYGAVGAPNVGHHRWQPYSRRPLVVGSAYQKHLVRLILRELRERDPAPERGLRVAAAVLTVLVHALALFLMLLSRSPGSFPPPTGHEPVATVQVRLIKNPQPPPPPPPITLPKRQAQRAPPVAKQAPVAAMPPVPARAPAQPKITVTPSRPEVAQTPPLAVLPKVAAPSPRVATSPPAPQPPPPVIEASAPPKVVLETSNMAVPPPQVQELEVTPAEVPATRLQPVPARQEAPQVTLGRTDLQVIGSEPVQAPASRAQASLPAIAVTPVAQPVTNVPVASAPTVIEATPTPPAVQAPQVRAVVPAPAPQVPVANTAPALNLPVANVPVPQAPRVEAPQVQIQMPAANVAAASPASAPATMASAAAPSTARIAQASSSWVPANDQFKPLSGKQKSAGQVNQGAGQGHARQAQDYVELPPRGNSDVMTRSSDHLGYKPTIFEQYWAPDNESILDTFLRHFIEKLTVRHTFHLAPGVRVHCVLGPLAVFLGCGGDPPRPVSDKSGDPRLDMAPARPLAPGLGTPASAAPATPLHLDNQAACDAARVAGSPPPPGCPGAPVPPSQSDQWQPSGGGK